MSISSEIKNILSSMDEVDTTNSAEYFNNNFLVEINNDIIREAVKHFTSFRPRSYDEDARYFYNKEELRRFYKEFEEAGGDIKTLIQSDVLDDCDEFYCYEIKRNRAYINKVKERKKELARLEMIAYA